MKSIIIGGGKVGYNLLKMLKERGYDVTLVERNEDVCRKIAEDTDTDVICGDGTDIAVLNDAGIMRADIIAAVTGNDEENLVVCQIAKRGFHIKKSIDLPLPPQCTLASILRDEKVIFPRGDTQILLNDNVHIITNQSIFPEIKELIQNGGPQHEKQKK